MNLTAREIAQLAIATALSILLIVLASYAAVTPEYSLSSQLLTALTTIIGTLLAGRELKRQNGG